MRTYRWAERQPRQRTTENASQKLRDHFLFLMRNQLVAIETGVINSAMRYSSKDFQCLNCKSRMRVYASLNVDTGELLIAPAWSGHCHQCGNEVELFSQPITEAP